jgi:hypothetical protein
VGIEGAAGLLGGFAVIPSPLTQVAVLASILSLVLRFRRTRGQERQQLKWFTYAAALMVVIAILGSYAAMHEPESAEVRPFLVTVDLAAIAAVSVVLGIAILRHRLFDIDLLINRTVVYGALTAALGLAYWASVLVL